MGRPSVGAQAPLAGRALSQNSPQREPKSSGDVVHIGGYHRRFAAAWAMQALK